MLEERSKSPAWKVKVWRLLYKAYKSNSGAGSVLRNRITPLGYIVAIALIFAGSLRLGGSGNFLFSIIALLAAVMVCSFCFVFLRRASLEIERKLPTKASVNMPLTYTVKVKTLCRL